MPDNVRNREWLGADELESGAPGLPRADLNPLVNPLLGKNMGRWAQVYFTSPPNQREQAVEKLLEELKAESGTNKLPGSESTRVAENAALPRVPKSRPEIEFPELPLTGSANYEPDLVDDTLQDLIMCPGCLHKNPVEQRFCGICGTALSQTVAARTEDAAPRAQASRPAENPESDWRWLRERTFSTYEVQSETGSRSRALFFVLAFLVIAVGGYFLWQNRARFSHEQAAPSSPPVSEPSSAPSMNLPIATAPSPLPVVPTPKTRTQTNVSAKSAPQRAVQDKVDTPTSDSSGVLPSEDGREELNRAHQYLVGEGVPKNSWMASQLLWKAVGKQNSEAVLLLSDLYARGDGVPHSCEQARILLVSAAKKGSSEAAQKLRSIETSCR